MYLSATFKQAILNSQVQRGEFERLWHDGKNSADGWVTTHFGVADDDVIHHHLNGTWSSYGFTITHLESGYAVMSFEAHHIALNFMLELEREFGELELLDRENRQRFVQYVKSRGRHACETFFPKDESQTLY